MKKLGPLPIVPGEDQDDAEVAATIEEEEDAAQAAWAKAMARGKISKLDQTFKYRHLVRKVEP